MTNNSSHHSTRRTFLKTAALSVVIAPLGAKLISQPAYAAGEELPPLDVATNPTAASLGYVDDATTADKAKFPNYKEGDDCSNCQLYLGAEGSARGGCQIFPGSSVDAKGWCASHTPKA